MKLTPFVEVLLGGRFKASFVELPTIFFIADTEKVALGRIERLAHALSSPHIRIDRILPDGDVVLVLDRHGTETEEDEEEDEPLPDNVFQFSLSA